MGVRVGGRLLVWGSSVLATVVMVACLAPSSALATKARSHASKHVLRRANDATKSFGELDCNGHSPIQNSVRPTMACTDVRGFTNLSNSNTWGGHFYDNGNYIGHDEPDMGFYSNRTGSGNDVTWTETLPREPHAAPTVLGPGLDVVHTFELSVAPWFSMMMCDPKSYPQNSPCSPQSDSNAPTCVGANITNCFPGAGNAFMELQFYPPGFPPVNTGIGCDDTHWCSALNIDSLECTLGFAKCNLKCEEPVNFALIQTDGVPAGPPSPQQTDTATFTPNAHTLLMNPGDTITIHMFNARVPGERHSRAFEVVIEDLTTGQSGFMQASGANGFMNTSMADCSGTPFNFQPEYNTAAPANISPWAAIATDISTQFEIGHFEPCSRVTDPTILTQAPGIGDTAFTKCHGPYENAAPGGDGSKKVETTDSPCYRKGDTHGVLNTAPDTVTGCLVFDAGGDLDFEGTPYWPDWPIGVSPTSQFPGSFVQALPTTSGRQYSRYMIQTDTALSEATCTAASTAGCALPPPQAPGQFFPFWSRVGEGPACTLQFGNVTSGPGVNNLGGDAQYGTDQRATLGYDEFEGPIQPNTCA